MTIYFQRFFQGPSAEKHRLYATQTMQRLTRGPLHMELSEILRFTIEGPYCLTVDGGLSMNCLRGDKVVEVFATKRSYGGYLHFRSLDKELPDLKLDVYVERPGAATIVKLNGFGVRDEPDVGRVYLGNVIGHERAELDPEDKLPALHSQIIMPKHVAPFADCGWILLISAEPHPRLLRILKDSW